MSQFAPPEVVKAAIASGSPARYLCSLMMTRIEAQHPEIPKDEVGRTAVNFMVGISAAFDLFMEISELPEEKACHTLQAVSDDLDAFREVLLPVTGTTDKPTH